MNKLDATRLIYYVVCKKLPTKLFKDFMTPGGMLYEIPFPVFSLFKQKKDGINFIFMVNNSTQKQIFHEINDQGGISRLVQDIALLGTPFFFFVSEECVIPLRRMFFREKICIFEYEVFSQSNQKPVVCSFLIDFYQKHHIEAVEPICFN